MTAVLERVEALTSEQLVELVREERWFASKGREAESAHVAAVHYADDRFAIALAEIRFLEGTHETYVLALDLSGDEPRDALLEPELAGRLLELAGVRGATADDVRPMGVEQSNSSVVVDGRHALKLYRRIEPGPNPELEMLQALAAQGFRNAPALEGALEHVAAPLDATIGVVTGFVDAAGGGWELALDGLAGGDPDWLPDRAGRLGEVTGAMHTALAKYDDPHFGSEEPSGEAVALLTASVEEEVDRLFIDLPPNPALDEVSHRAGELRDLVGLLGSVGPAGRFLRIHGDYHLGQVLWARSGDWVVIDFEGEPGRSLPERRQRGSALRDVAGMLRSFAYAADGAKLLRGVEPPPGWAQRCREAFLSGYRGAVDQAVLPPSEGGASRLTALFELQKLVYEVRYEVNNRPEWAGIPIRGLLRLLEEAV